MIYEFCTHKTPRLSEVGGKAKSLIEMTKAGLRVPEGIVLSVAFFTPWLTEIKSSDLWRELIEKPTIDKCNIIKKVAEGLTFTREQEDELSRAMDNMTGYLFAVRSSSPEEDLEGTSFAGMYETILGVTIEDIESSVAKAFSSMFDYRVVGYKDQNKINLEHTSISVIIQRQIPSDVSGIAFSINPENNCYDEAMINASFGLGETVVSGTVTPDTYIVEKVKHEIIDKKINKKSIGLWLNKDGGTIEKRNDNETVQALSDQQILEVTKLVITCEDRYGMPMDIEWAYEGDCLYLLQARPITTYLPLFPEIVTKPGEEKYLYVDVMGLTQGFTDCLSVLGMDIFTKMLELAKGDILPIGIDGGLVALHGRQYMHISNLAKGLGIKAVKKIYASYDGPTQMTFKSIDFKQEYLPAKKTDKMKKVMRGMLRYTCKMGPPAIKALVIDHRKLRDQYVTISKESRERIRTGLKVDKPFNETIDEALDNFAKIIESFGIILAGMVAMNKIKKIFKGDDIEDLVISLGMDLDGNPTSAMGHYMYKLACYEEIKHTKSGREFARRIKNREYSDAFLENYHDYMSLYGCRGFKEIDIASSRAYEDLEAFFEQLKAINTESNQLLYVKKRRREAYKQLLAIAKDKGHEKKFVKYATMYHETFGFREDPKYIYVFAVAKLRKIALKLGERFVQEGRLQSREQIFDLHAKQIAKAQENPSYNIMKVRKENLAPYRLVEHVKEWPNIIDSRGKIFRPIRKSEDGDIIGDPIAPGIVKGRAKVLHSPYEKPLEPGEIIVTKATEPAWTPIFINAAGVVLEVGGPLQHGAIIAREYGIPCVSGVYNAQKIIKDGDLLEVDGSSGIVKILTGS